MKRGQREANRILVCLPQHFSLSCSSTTQASSPLPLKTARSNPCNDIVSKLVHPRRKIKSIVWQFKPYNWCYSIH